MPRASLPLRTALLAALLGPAADAASGPSPLVKAEQLQGRAEALTGGRWVSQRDSLPGLQPRRLARNRHSCSARQDRDSIEAPHA